ncbi:Fis family transcriptional regulator [alpha proteobacterium AAP81b]|nr:Fis family transcriptional regulator [alpha proteobacterium AAP81b]
MSASPASAPAPAPDAPGDWLPGLAQIDLGDTLLVTDGSRPLWRHVALARAARSKALILPGRLELRVAPADHEFATALIAAFAAGEERPAAADPASRDLLALAGRVAAHDVTVLIEGETGTGKEGLARLVHTLSPRRDSPLVAVNCAALPETMLEAALFGHERGAFTGASAPSRGLIRSADKGSLLLDEVSELPLVLQAKLLRTLQEREVLAIGANRAEAVDVRFIACANRDLAGEVAAGRFRADLFYRLAVFPLRTLPLKARPDDIAAIAARWLLRAARGLVPWLTASALARLKAHDWPGNVRELGNVLDRALVLTAGDTIDPEHLVFDRLPVAGLASAAAPLTGIVRHHEDKVIRSVIAESHSRRAAAERLGISERTLRYKLAAMRRPSTTVQ